MANSFHTKLPHLKRYPGNEYYYVICDICGKQIRKKDAIYITDQYNKQNRLLVCKNDVDKRNEQSVPFTVKESKIPTLTRPDAIGSDLSNANSSRVPSAPKLLKAYLDPINDVIDLSWFGPDDCGSDLIIGYAVYFTAPQLGTLQILMANTNNNLTFYQDYANVTSGSYAYGVRAINNFGMGAISELAYFPSYNDPLVFNQRYVVRSDDGFTLQTGDGINIIVSV
jgi:hypothetical protein